jgi:hypothetical protein
MNEELLDKTMKKSDLVRSIERMSLLTKQALASDLKLAQEYYEKTQHLHCILRMVSNFEHKIKIDLDVD